MKQMVMGDQGQQTKVDPETFPAVDVTNTYTARSLKRALGRASPETIRTYNECIRRLRVVTACDEKPVRKHVIFQRNDRSIESVRGAAKLLRHEANGWTVRVSMKRGWSTKPTHVITYHRNDI